MQALIELLAGFIALLAAATLSQFGVDMHANPAPDREIHRIQDCGDKPPSAGLLVSVASEKQGNC